MMSESWDQTRLAHRDRQAASIATAALTLATQHGAPGLTMAAIAKQADVSRQTLYRYFPDVDAVLVGIAELIASHDETFERHVADQPDPRTQLDLIAATATNAGHGQHDATTLRAMLPPAGRDILANHEARSHHLLASVLRRGIEDGSFLSNLEPDADAPLILGLLAAADPDEPERAIALVHRLVAAQTHTQMIKENEND